MELQKAANFISFLTIITFLWIAEIHASREYFSDDQIIFTVTDVILSKNQSSLFVYYLKL